MINNINCILCTCNGGKYIYEQLESIGQQTVKIEKLIIVDDVSDDDTISIIKKWSDLNDLHVELYRNESRLGVVKNFEKALSITDGEYTFFADQDDVWQKDKIELSMKKIKELERVYGKETPCLVYTDLTVVDKRLNVVNGSFMKNQWLKHIDNEEKQLSHLMVQNFVTGCTMVINKALKNKAMPFPEQIVMHDYWLALVAAMTGKIGFLDKSTILYRQHGDNQVGAVRSYLKKSVLRILDVNGIFKNIDAKIRQLKILCNYKNGELMAKDRCVIITEFLQNLEKRKYFTVISNNICEHGGIFNFFLKCYLILYIARGKECYDSSDYNSDI